MKVDRNAAYWVALRAAEAQILQGALDRAGNVIHAAAILGIDPSSFRQRCRAVGVHLKVRGRARDPQKHAARLPMRFPASGDDDEEGESP